MASRVTDLRDCLLWLQVVVDHGLAPNASQGDLWSEARWHGFSSTFEGQGITPLRLGIKSQPAAWELSSGMQVLAAMQASMLSSALARCEHDGILTMGSQSLQQVAHLAMERGCWSGGGLNYTKNGVSAAAVLATFDDDQLARTMLEAGALEVIISGVHDAKFVVRTAAPSPSISRGAWQRHICAPPRHHDLSPVTGQEAFVPIALLSLGSNVTSSALLPATNTVIDAGSLVISRDTTSLEADKQCAAMCIVEAALSNASSQQCLGSHGTGALTLSSLHGGAADHGVSGNVSVCFEAGDTCVLEDHEARCSYGKVQQSSSPPPPPLAPEVRIGGLFPLSTSVTKLGRFAAFVMAVDEINNSTELLPGVKLR